ncbi:hypothetical protein ETAA8_24740 [Anatilimnocola aggregata]|uniref:Uncharacterized protein n=1 Tax=Anatilimnocola aggregata TaxID=2528021 RepID=A0A517YAW9_9BACT|nr:hypothetical protein [Anatilimnocola aggregata]QDU27387.1 hypothetical protein ETAA8_24740 [Anatilimnocola aggregata]
MSKSTPLTARPKKHLYLKRANDKLVCHCQCDEALITFPPQMDCPWCGCGWLFCCAKCRKAFSFAVAVELNESWEATALRDLQGRGPGFDAPTEDDVAAWVEAMQVMCEELELGEEYVYLDGWFIPTTVEEISMEGMHSYHEINCVPQVEALTDKSVVEELLSNEEYWTENQVPEDDEHEHEEGEDDEDEDDEEDR